MTANLPLVAQRLDRIEYGCGRGQSYSQTKGRLDRLAPLLDGYPELADRVAAAVGPRWLSLGDRCVRIRAARDAVLAAIEQAPDDAP